ncbi:SCO6745 family protein [Actinopolyspora saharensis]|uniref:SCO6745 family protein n=1 Tax=Actinopolyspora saharensis TaxID=995062 RepID=UPI003F676171
MQTKIAREAKQALEAPHSMIYFAPEAERETTALGLEPGSMSYFAARAAPLGPVGPGVVSATFYNFNPELVAMCVPKAWSIADPADIVAARFRAASAALERMLGSEALESETVREAAELATRATEACSPAGKPLFAAHADLDWPEQPHLRLWHALTLLREFRGDAHIAALQHAGIGPLEALVLQNATGKGMTAATLRRTRHWSEQDWEATRRELTERGLLEESGELSDEGRELRERIEEATDEAALPPWLHLDSAERARLFEHGAALSKQVVKAGAFPKEAFIQ